MISFLNSILLPALAAAAIPLLIHFFNRQKTKKIEFSSLRFLKLLESKRIRQVKLYQILLIILRTLFILFIVLAFTRPTVTENLPSITTPANTTAVIILDDSYSMRSYAGSITRFEQAILHMREQIGLFNQDDRVFLLTPSKINSPVQINTQDISNLPEPTFLSPDFTNILRNASDIFEKYPNYNKELYIYSDFQVSRKAIPDSIDSIFKDETIRTFLIDVSGSHAFENAGIDTVIIQNQLFERDKPVNLTVRVRNFSEDSGISLPVNLYAGDTRVAMEQVKLEPSAVNNVEMAFVPNKTGQQLMHVELEDDDLSADNYYYFSINVPEKLSVLFVDDQTTPFLNHAVDVLSLNTIFNIEHLGYSAWQGANFDKFDLIVLNDPGFIRNETAGRLASFVKNGKSIILIPGSQMTITELNSVINMFGIRNCFIDFKSTNENDSYYSLRPVDTISPLFSLLFSGNAPELDMPKVYRYFRIKGVGITLLSFNNGDPFLSEITFSDPAAGSLFIFSSLFELSWTDFPVKGLFVPMLYRSFYFAAQKDLQAMDQVQTGDVFYLSRPDLSFQNSYSVQPPGKDKLDIVPEQTSSGLRFKFENIDQPGHYHLFSDNGPIQSFAVNVSSKELRRPYQSFDKITSRVFKFEGDDPVKEQILNARSGFELWYIFLFLALCTLITEMIVIKKMER